MGGLGFRDLKVFNQALLAKQAWRIMQNDQSIIHKVFKARYFKNSDFLSSYCGFNPSYTWRSIWGSKSLLLEGLKWRVGNGSCIDVWNDAWIPGENAAFVPTPKPSSTPNLQVAHLINHDNFCWDEEALRRELNEDDAAKIQLIQISERLPKDQRYWWPTKNGLFTTKTGYWLGKLGNTQRWMQRRDNEDEKVWQTVWQINAPPKLKHFVWRATSNSLAVKENLAKRNITPESLCAICKAGVESIMHALFDCTEASKAWIQSCYMGHLFEAPATSFRDRLSWCATNLNKEDLTNFLTTAWACWKARNDIIFQETLPIIEHLVASFMSLTAEYKKYASKVFQCKQTNTPHSSQEWKAPPEGTMKINTDARILENGKVGLGVVIRNEQGVLKLVAVKHVMAGSSPEFAEALAGKWGLQLAATHGLSRVILESDALGLIQNIAQASPNLSPLGLVIEDIVHLSKLFELFEASHVKRAGNLPAHQAARLSPSNGVEDVYCENFPQGISTLVGLESPA